MPVKPVWPMARADRRVPHDEVGCIVSQPSARELPGTVARAAKRAAWPVVIPADTMTRPCHSARNQRAKAPTAAAVPKRPACPAAPPSAAALSSCTAPTSIRSRQGDTLVGATRARHSSRTP